MKKIIIAISILLAANTSIYAQNAHKHAANKPAAVRKEDYKADNKSLTSSGKSDITKLSADKVCMINNKLMSKPQIAVPVSGKVYYGCCQMCVSKLTDDAKSRMATDALTQQQVDKATAYIILKPGSEDDVLYFSSESNAKKYLQQGNNR